MALSLNNDPVGPIIYGGALVGALADIQAVYLSSPLLGFLTCGVLGGLAGWAFALEQGKLDRIKWRPHVCFVARRLMMGITFAVMAWLIWPVERDHMPTGGMLTTGLLAAFPLEVVAALKDTAIDFLKKRMG